MNEPNDFQQFLTDPDAPPRKQFTEVPPPLPPTIDPMPTGLAPMSRIELEGRSYRGFASGEVPWWVLISGAVVFIVPGLCMAIVAGGIWSILIVLPILSLPIAIVWRGIHAKLVAQKEKQQRQARRLRDMRD